MSAGSSPIDSVEIRARVSGYLDRIHFTDGQMVKQGDLLFTIDKRPFQTDARSGQGQSPAGAGQSRLYRGRSRPRRAAREGAHHHRADLRSAHPGQARRRSLGRGADGRGEAGDPRSRIHGAAGAGRRPDRRPPGVAGQSRHRKHDGQHLAARDDRVDRPDPLRIRLRRGVLSALRAARKAAGAT